MEEGTKSPGYAQRLKRHQASFLKRTLAPVNPYRWNVRRLCRGRVLDVGCGIGRNLTFLGDAINVGIDHNVDALEIAKMSGHTVFTPGEFENLDDLSRGDFDTLLLSHVLEHLSVDDAGGMLTTYINFLRPGGKVVLICPQERGYRSDSTHVTYFDEASLTTLAAQHSHQESRYFSFPFPRRFGNAYIYNEHIFVMDGVRLNER